MQLIIAEKNSVGKSIATALGGFSSKHGYLESPTTLISWCVGHLVGLAEPDAYDPKYAKRDLADLPIIPTVWKTTALEDTKSQLSILLTLMGDPRVTEIVCATDAGREGELIFRLVYEKSAQPRKPVKRLWISSMETTAIRDGMSSLQDSREFDRLYDAALCRARADWLIGMNGSRLFSGIHHTNLRVGRVQTPTLALVVERDAKIKGFKKEKSYTVTLKKDGFKAESATVSQSEAQVIQAACHGKQAACTI